MWNSGSNSCKSTSTDAAAITKLRGQSRLTWYAFVSTSTSLDSHIVITQFRLGFCATSTNAHRVRHLLIATIPRVAARNGLIQVRYSWIDIIGSRDPSEMRWSLLRFVRNVEASTPEYSICCSYCEKTDNLISRRNNIRDSGRIPDHDNHAFTTQSFLPR